MCIENCISKKALVSLSGELMTTAGFIRQFVTSHAAYKQDSVVSDEIAYDLMLRMKSITDNVEPCHELTGKIISKTPEQYRVL